MRSFYRRLQPREQRAILVLAVAVVLILAFQFAVSPMMDSTVKAQAELPLKEKRLHKYRALVGLVGTAETDWKALERRLGEAEKGLLDSKTAPLASAELQDRVRQLLTQQGIDPKAMGFLPVRTLPPADSGYIAVPLSLGFECAVDQLANLMTAFQSAGKTLAVETLSVDAVNRGEKAARKMVNVRLVVRAVMRSEG